MKASQGRTKTRLVVNPAEQPAVQAIYRWRTVRKLGVPTITGRLNGDPAAYPSRDGKGWTDPAVRTILANPKYTGHQVYGRRTKRNGRVTPAPPEAWLWTPEPVHEPIITMDTWKAAQAAGTEHATSRDPGTPGPSRGAPTSTGAASAAATAPSAWPAAPSRPTSTTPAPSRRPTPPTPPPI